MRFFRAVILLALGILLGAALGYAALSWLRSRSAEAGSEAGGGQLPDIIDRLRLRIQEAIDEGKRAAAAARAELEQEAYGRPDIAPGSEASGVI
jgi:hypothetical protein